MAFDIPGITFLEKHERLIIVVLVLVFGVWVYSRGLNYLEKRDQAKLDTLTQQLNDTKAQVAAATQAATAAQADAAATKQAATQQQTANAAIINSLSAQNVSLNKIIAARDKATQTQQQVDLHATIPELSKQFMALVPGINPADIKVAPDASTATIGQDTAQKTVAQLELVPDLTNDNKNLQTENDNLTKEVASVQKTLDMETQYATAEEKYALIQEKTVALLNTQIAQADKLCDAQVAIEKQKGRKSFLKGLGIGTVVGFVGGILLGHGI